MVPPTPLQRCEFRFDPWAWEWAWHPYSQGFVCISWLGSDDLVLKVLSYTNKKCTFTIYLFIYLFIFLGFQLKTNHYLYRVGLQRSKTGSRTRTREHTQSSPIHLYCLDKMINHIYNVINVIWFLIYILFISIENLIQR